MFQALRFGLVVVVLFVFSSAIGIGRSDSLRMYRYIDSLYSQHQENNIAEGMKLTQRMEALGNYLAIDTLIMNAKGRRAECYAILGMIDQATAYYYDILKLASRTGELNYEANALYRLAMIEQNLGNFPKSNQLLEQAKEKFVKAHHYNDTITVNYELGFNLVVDHDFEKGIAIVKQNLDAAKKVGDPTDIVLGLDNLSNIYFEKGDLQLSLWYLLEILKYPKGFESKYRKAAIYEHLAELNVALKNWGEAKKYLAESFRYAEEMKSADWLLECYKMQAAIAEGTGDFRLALSARKKQLDLKDTLFQKEVENKIVATSTLYELDKKQDRIALLEKDNQLNTVKLSKKEFQRNAAIGISLLSIAAIVLAFLAWMQRRTRQLQVAFSRSLMQSQEAERQRISRELHDSVGQNILFIRNQLLAMEKVPQLQPVMETIASTMEDIRSLSKDLYPNQLEKYGLAAAVDALCEKVAAATGIFASSDIQEIEQLLSREAVINCYRIVQESLNNIIKHAGATAVRITGTCTDAGLLLSIMDNGIGFDTDVLEKKSQSSFGLLNMEERAKMLGGKMEIQSNKSGTRINITLPR